MILDATEENLLRAVAELRAGNCVAFPTETVYGLGADARRPSALARIYALKGRPPTNPLIVHVPELSRISEVAETAPYTAHLEALSTLWPGPLTVVLPRKSSIPAIVSGGGDTVGVRIPSHPIAQRLLQLADIPIAAPSANRSKRVSPTTALHVAQEFGENVSCVIDGGACPVGIESTVLSLVTPLPTILRPGSVTASQLEAILGPVQHLSSLTLSSPQPLPSPGLLTEHYAPRTTTKLWSRGEPAPTAARWGIITQSTEPPEIRGYSIHRSLSPGGELHVVARNLFATLRFMDDQGLDLIVVERCREEGIGVAIMDRLKRASAREGN